MAHPALTPEDLAQRALSALREVARAALGAERVEDTLQFTLERVIPVVGASFASAYLADDGDLMRLGAASNWPEKWRPWLGQMRVRIGSGPSGVAASERRVIEVPDVFADPALKDWQEVAEELGFRALIALPLLAGTRALGVVTFYFVESGGFSSSQRDLLRVATDQMALAAAQSALAARLRQVESRVAEAESVAGRQKVAAIEAARARDEFLANVSHELKTPLTIVLGTIDLLQEELGGPLTVGQQSDLNDARIASERLLGLVETLLALAALRRGTLPLAFDAFDPRVPLREAIASVGPAPAGVEFVVLEPATFIPPMHSDREKVTRILSALVSNAFKFTSSGRITTRVTVSAGRVRYDVDDTGIGIGAEAQTLIFEEFRQADGSATRRFGGSGLGLALARGLARLLGGDITVVSEAGQGSRFSVDLPLQQPVQQPVN